MTKKELGVLITKHIEKNNITQYAIIKHTNLFHGIIKKIKSGENSYEIGSLIKMLDFLGLELLVKEKS